MENTSIEPELQSLRVKLEAKIEKNTNHIEILKKENIADEALLQNVKRSLGALHPESKQTGYGSKSETIRDAIKSIPIDRFTQDQVEAAILLLKPGMPLNRNRIRAALWALQDRGEMIKVFTKGNNNQPAVYQKLSISKHESNGSNGNLPLADGAIKDLKRVEITESGRRPYGSSSETILSVLKGANGKPLQTKQIVTLSGASYGTTYRILRGFEKEKKAQREKDKWTLVL
jgi:hypothetical protein